MKLESQTFSQYTRYGFIIALLAISLTSSVSVLAGEYFDKDDQEGLKHLSGALMAWYAVNQLGQPKSEKDMEKVFSLLGRVYSECKQVPDTTLKKVDTEFASQLRENLQVGVRQYESGLRAYWEASKKGNKPTAKAKSDMNSGQQKMVRFHRYYNANIERIVRNLKSKGVDIFG